MNLLQFSNHMHKHRRASVLALLALLMLTLTGCFSLPPTAAERQSEDEMSMIGEVGDDMSTDVLDLPDILPGELTVTNVMASATAEGVPNGAVYLVVLNGTDQLLSLTSAEVSGDVAGVVELHETIDDDGVMRMVPQPDGFEISSGNFVALEPGGKHIMLEQLVEPLSAGGTFDMVLNFDNGESIEVNVPVVEISEVVAHGAMNEDAMGENVATDGAMSQEATNDEMMENDTMGDGDVGGDTADDAIVPDDANREVVGDAEPDRNENTRANEIRALVERMQTLDIDGLRDLATRLSDGELDAADDLVFVNNFRAEFEEIGWPYLVFETAGEINRALEQLERAIQGENLGRAAELANTATKELDTLQAVVAASTGVVTQPDEVGDDDDQNEGVQDEDIQDEGDSDEAESGD